MPLRQRTFAPRVLDAGSLLRAAEYSSIDQITEEAGAWIDAEGIDVVSVETLLLETSASAPPDLGGNGQVSWDAGIQGIYQYVRVWYRTP